MINKMKNIKKLLEIIVENNFEKNLKEAIDIYHKNYIFQIKKLTEEFPADFINNDGSLFWSGSKRFPDIIDYNINDIDCFNFIEYYSIIFTRSINVKIYDDENYIRKIVEKVNLPEYIKEEKMLTRDEELKEISYVKTFLNNFDSNKIDISHIIPEKFEKDNDSNKHVFFINLCSNLRAKNYKIAPFDEQTTKMIAGRIVPAISTTNSVITGFACMQLITLINSEDISLIKNCYFDSSLNVYQFNNPDEVIQMKDQEYNAILDGPTIAVPGGWTVWDLSQ